MKRFLTFLGTRPEAIKLAPVIREFRARDDCEIIVCSTGQHKHMLEQVLELFDITPDHDLAIMQDNQTLSGLASRALGAMDEVFDTVKPTDVIVQGDTSTSMLGALAAFYRRIPVAHIEAGLRTHRIDSPFPEEMNRRIISMIADLNFPPTRHAEQALLAEGIAPEKIVVAGNTVIDALVWVRERLTDAQREKFKRPGERLILVTAHRRESFGETFRNLCQSLKTIVQSHDDLRIVYPVHLNPNVQGPVFEILGDVDRIDLIEPIGYQELVAAMDASTLVLTDSGGIQEEAPSLNKPVLVMREATERPEGVEAGAALLVGTNPDNITREVLSLLDDPKRYEAMANVPNPYGAGDASKKIAAALLD